MTKPSNPRVCRSLRALVLLLSLVLPLAGPVWGQQGKTKVLLIGTQDFVSPTFPSLAGIPTDIELMKTTLSGSCGVAPENIKTILSTRSNVVPKASVVASLESFFNEAGPNDALVVYLTSHGVVYEGEYQIAMTETRVSPDTLKQTSLNAGQLKKWTEKSKAKTVLVILDTCQFPLSQQMAAEIAAAGKAMSNRSASGMNSQVAAKFLGNPQNGAGIRAILYSCRPSEESYMDTNYLTGTNNSYFTLALCEGLQGKAAASDGEISLKSLNDYTSRRLGELIDADRQHRISKGQSSLPGQQTSNMEVLGGQPSSFVLATANPAPPTTAAAPAPYAPSTYPAAPQPAYPAQPVAYAPPGYPAPTSQQASYAQPATGYPGQQSYPQPQTASSYPVVAAYPAPAQAYPSQNGYGQPQAPTVQPYPSAPQPMTAVMSPSNAGGAVGYPSSPSSPASYPNSAPQTAPQGAAPTVASAPVGVAPLAPGNSASNKGQMETTRVTGGILELFPSAEFQVASADLPAAAKGVARDPKAAAKIAPEDFGLQLRYDRGESDANIRVTVNSLSTAPAANVFVRVMASADRQTWSPVREWDFRLPGGYRVSRDYVGSDPQLFAHPVFFLRAELVLPNDTVVVREGRFTAQVGPQ